MKFFISKLHYKKELLFYEKVVMQMLQFFSFFYGKITKIRNKMYDKKLLRRFNSKSFVISIGNLTTGGVGKTPVVLETVKYYLGLNKKTAVIMRGYNGQIDNRLPHLISDGSGALFSAKLAGDEAVWLSNNAKGAYVVTCRDRVEAEKFLKEKFNPDIIILDDGFQYRRMKRDIDIVLIDAKFKFGNGKLLPAGPLREEISNILRADKIVVVNKNFDSKNALKYCEYLQKRYQKDTYLCKIVPECVYNIVNNEELPKNVKIIAFSAIGQSSTFYNFLKKDYNLTAVLDFEDHHIYDKVDISKIIHFAQEENVEYVVTTEKDAVKLTELISDIELPVKFYALKLKAYIDIKDICGI